MSSTSDFAYAQMSPEDTSDDFNVLNFIVRQILAQVATVKIVQVQAVHPGTGTPPLAGTVDVLPMVTMVDGNGNVSSHGVVYGVPYFRMQSGAWAIIAEPVVNDVGIMICADRDISYVKKAYAAAQPPAQPVNPGSYRMFDFADGIYLGGLFAAAPTSYMELNSDGSLNITDKFGNVLKTSNTGFALTGDLAVTGKITASSTVQGTIVTGTTQVVAGSGGTAVHLSTHTHGGVTTGGSTSGVPTPGS